MFSQFQEQDYSGVDIPSALTKLDRLADKLEEKFPGKSIDELSFALHKRKATVITSDRLITVIKEANSQKRNTFTEYFVLSDLKDKDAVVCFDGGQITSDDEYPGCLTYDSVNDTLDQRDVLLLKDVAAKGGTQLQFREKFHKSDDILVAAGFENYDESYWFDGWNTDSHLSAQA